MDKSNGSKSRKVLITAVFAVATLASSAVRADEPAPPPPTPPEPTAAPAAEPAPLPTAPPETAKAAVVPAETGVTATALPPAAAPKAPPPPYSIPWQLRPVAAATVLRSDTSVGFYDGAMGSSGSTVATMLLGSYKLTPELAPMVRLGFVQNSAPTGITNGTSFVNPIVGLTYAKRMNSIRFALFGGAAVPIGMGGGNTPDPGTNAANAAGIATRSAMDNAMYAVNYFTPLVGAGVAYVDNKLTVQLEATVLQLFRVRGDSAPTATDSTRTNSTAGIHVGYFVLPMLSFGAEFRYQRWLTTPTRSVMGVKMDFPSANMDTMSVAIGPRAHFAIGNGMWLRPGISYSRVLDKPLSDASYNMVQIDVPVVF